ncbi:hypothetical protein Agabi119p4_10716 [Agaricus bisporus var. burnettii]|uniref:F-box domain-containing protein n=1 Tax=Agaricus bisporus var. burnettii TaxID=192524 RepID=A0A8H7EWW2_AGABI|nr:hypothetical protein Agabi119p4_10716 [Agaricus bisporus var. burnettii]
MNSRDPRSTTAINNLPNEVLLRIISETIAYALEPHEWLPCTPHHYQTRAVIKGVCRKWHHLMDSSPELWTSFTIGDPWGDQTKANIIMPSRGLLEIWQARSRDWPINIHLYSGPFAVQPDDSILMMTTLLPSTHRWSRLDLAFDERTAEAFLDLDHLGFGLKDIRASSFCCAKMNDQLLRAFGQCPNLERLVWIFAVGLPMTDQPTFHNALHLFPWERLCHISLEVSWTSTEFCSFFRSSTSAQSIQLNMQQHPADSSGIDLHPIITLPKLRYLGIESASSIYYYVGCLNLPGIQYLAIIPKMAPLQDSSGWGAPPAAVANPLFQDFLERTMPSAQAMIIHGYPFSNLNAIRLFSNECLLRIPVLEIEVGESTAVAVIEYFELSGLLTGHHIEHQGPFMGWCYDSLRCCAVRDIFSSFYFNYHVWIH